MRASEIVRELQRIIETTGQDLEVDVSVDNQVDIPVDQNYFVADATFVVVEEYAGEKRIAIRDWPY